MARSRVIPEVENIRAMQQAGTYPGTQPSLAVEPPADVAPAATNVAPAATDVAPAASPAATPAATSAAPSLAVDAWGTQYDPATWKLNQWGKAYQPKAQYDFSTNKGNDAGTITTDPNANYRFVNGNYGGVAYEGQGEEGLSNIYDMASRISQGKGKTAAWQVQVQDPATGEWKTAAHDDPAAPSFIGKALQSLGPVAGSALGIALAPYTGGMSLVALGALGAAGGSLAGNMAAGKSFGDSFLDAGITGMSSAATAGIGGKLTPALGKIGGAAVAGAGVEGAKTAVSGGSLGDIVKSAGMGGAQAAGGAYLQGKLAPTGEVNNITGALDRPYKVDLTDVMNYDFGTPDLGTGTTSYGGGGGGGLSVDIPKNVTFTGSSNGTAASPDMSMPTNNPEGNIDVIHPIRNPFTGMLIPLGVGAGAAGLSVAGAGGGGAGGAATGAADAGYTGNPEGDITITGGRTAATNFDPFGTGFMNTLTQVTGMTPEQAAAAVKEDPSLLDRIKNLSPADVTKFANYARLAALGIGTIGNLIGGSNSKTGKIPTGLFNGFKSNFDTGASPGGKLFTVPQARTMPAQDWNQYGFRPQQNFFEVPGQSPSYVPPLPGEQDPRYTGRSPGYAKGGEVTQSLAVRGPGTDRSDSIPAMLSDGEYVIDAPTVRKIGRGSTERGFSKLDDLRVMVHGKRPHKALKSLGGRNGRH